MKVKKNLPLFIWAMILTLVSIRMSIEQDQLQSEVQLLRESNVKLLERVAFSEKIYDNTLDAMFGGR